MGFRFYKEHLTVQGLVGVLIFFWVPQRPYYFCQMTIVAYLTYFCCCYVLVTLIWRIHLTQVSKKQAWPYQLMLSVFALRS